MFSMNSRLHRHVYDPAVLLQLCSQSFAVTHSLISINGESMGGSLICVHMAFCHWLAITEGIVPSLKYYAVQMANATYKLPGSWVFKYPTHQLNQIMTLMTSCVNYATPTC